MLTTGSILNPALLSVLARLGHGQVLIIADAGLPIGDDQQVIDLSLTRGLPSFIDVAAAVLDNAAFEAFFVASESEKNGAIATMAPRLAALKRHTVSHEEFKVITAGATAVIRTGECTPFANIALVAGTAF